MITQLTTLKKRLENSGSWRFVMLLPIALVCCFWLYKSVDQPIHDYANAYFPAQMAVSGLAPEEVVFDIFDFNQYVWEQGYHDVLVDFYLNSPFTATFFYPFALIKNVYQSKFFFNLVSIFLFVLGLSVLIRRYHLRSLILGLALPVIFMFSLRNQVMFGQSYMIVFAFTVIAFMAFESKKPIAGGGLLGLAILIKVFPVFYAIPLLSSKKRSPVVWLAVMGLVLLTISVLVSGSSFWQNYLVEVLPNAFSNDSTTDFRPNAQSMDSFLRIWLVYDPYYNPGAVKDVAWLYKLLTGLFKGLVLGVTLLAGYRYRKDLFRFLAICVVALFLIQSRTGTYAQILWLIPMFEFLKSVKSLRLRLTFLILLTFVCNFPFSWFINTPLIIQFSRLWASLLLAILFWIGLELRLQWKAMALGVLIILPLTLKGVLGELSRQDESEYVLPKKEYFIVHDFQESDGFLEYHAIGRNGDVSVKTDIPITAFDSDACAMIDGQVYLGHKQITHGPALKKRPVLINGCEVFFLTDRRSRRGAYAIKKVKVCGD